MDPLLSKRCCLLGALSLWFFMLPTTRAAEAMIEATNGQSAIAQINALDDFTDKNSRLNQMLAQKKAEQLTTAIDIPTGNRALDAQLALFSGLTLERQKWVNRLRALQRDNLRRSPSQPQPPLSLISR